MITYKQLIDDILEFAKEHPEVLNQCVSILVTHEDEVYPANSIFLVDEHCDHCMNSNGLGSLDLGHCVIETLMDKHIYIEEKLEFPYGEFDNGLQWKENI